MLRKCASLLGGQVLVVQPHRRGIPDYTAETAVAMDGHGRTPTLRPASPPGKYYKLYDHTVDDNEYLHHGGGGHGHGHRHGHGGGHAAAADSHGHGHGHAAPAAAAHDSHGHGDAHAAAASHDSHGHDSHGHDSHGHDSHGDGHGHGHGHGLTKPYLPQTSRWSFNCHMPMRHAVLTDIPAHRYTNGKTHGSDASSALTTTKKHSAIAVANISAIEQSFYAKKHPDFLTHKIKRNEPLYEDRNTSDVNDWYESYLLSHLKPSALCKVNANGHMYQESPFSKKSPYADKPGPMYTQRVAPDIRKKNYTNPAYRPAE